jgi:hypothetical protein
VTLDRQASFGDLPESQRYSRMLNGESKASVRASQGLSATAGLAGNAVGRLRERRNDAKERKATQRLIQDGHVNDISDR